MFHIPGKADPGILAYFGDKAVDQRFSSRIGVEADEMCFGQSLADQPGRFSGIDQIIDQQHPFAIAFDALKYSQLPCTDWVPDLSWP